MRDFLDDLDRQLSAMAEQHPDLDTLEQAAPEATPAKRRRHKRRPAVLGGLTALIAAIVAAFTMVGTSVAELPILGTPTQDASELKTKARAAADAGVDFEKAHVFGTPGGPGYALLNPKTQTLCLAIPDPAAPGEFGGSCGTPLSKVEREGLYTEIPGDLGRNPDATNLAVFVLPEGAEDVRLAAAPRGARLDVESGVAVVQTPAEVKLTWKVDGRRGERAIEGPFAKATVMGLICPDGRQVQAPALEEGDFTPAEVQRRMKAARAKACD